MLVKTGSLGPCSSYCTGCLLSHVLFLNSYQSTVNRSYLGDLLHLQKSPASTQVRNYEAPRKRAITAIHFLWLVHIIYF